MAENNYSEAVKDCQTIEELMKLWEHKPICDTEYMNKQHEKTKLKIDHSDRFIEDGIISEAAWGKDGNKKILYILKEAYTDEDEGYSLTDWLKKHPKKRMWDRIARWTYGIQYTTANDVATYVPELNKKEDGLRERCFEQIAVLNIKKSSGESRSNIEEINTYAEADRAELIRELQLVDPDIVVCGSTFWILYETIFGHKEGLGANANDNWFYYLNLDGKERLYIDYYHPANQYPDLVNYYAVMGIYQQALKARNVV